MMQARLNPGVFSRHYQFTPGNYLSVAYHTPSQTVALFEGDSAAVWQRIHDANGDTADALAYILANGTFDDDPETEAKAVLAGFVADLQDSYLLANESNDSVTQWAALRRERTNAGKEALKNDSDMEQQIGQAMADHHILHSLTLELTYRCNERCVHCYLPSSSAGGELTVSQIDCLLDEFRQLGGFNIQLTGGELFLRKDVLEILEIVRQKKLLTSITSNLTLIDDRVLGAVAAMYPRSVGCSIYAADPALHDAITRVPGSFDKSVAAIRSLAAVGIPVVIKSPLLRETAPHWRKIEELAQELGCGYQFDLSITAQNDGGLKPANHRVEDPALLQEIFSQRYFRLFTKDEALATMSPPSPEAGLCGAGASGLSIEPDGTVRPCIGLMETLGRYPQDSLNSIWHESPFFEQFAAMRMQDVPKCRDCIDFQFCSRCPGAWQVETGSYLIPFEYACKLANVRASVQRTL